MTWRGIYYMTEYTGNERTGPIKAYWWKIRIPVRAGRCLQRHGFGGVK